MSIPAGRDLVLLAYEFAQDKTDAWTDAKISKFDIMNNEYVVSGYRVQKIMVGFQKQWINLIQNYQKSINMHISFVDRYLGINWF